MTELRCATRHPDGRQCLFPSHGQERKHLLAVPGDRSEAAIRKVMNAWYSAKMNPERFVRTAVEAGRTAEEVASRAAALWAAVAEGIMARSDPPSDK